MEIKLAKYAGACYGVQRALDMANEVIADGRPAVTLGPLIHNPIVVADLAKHGVSAVESPATIDTSTTHTVVLRSHGVTPEMSAELNMLGVEIMDATCPHVVRAQRGASELASSGHHVLVVGEEGHPEVAALVAYAKQEGANVNVVLSPADIPNELTQPVGVVVQTTQTRANLDTIVEALRMRGVEPEVKDTICAATQKRQKAAAELAKDVDMMIVVGGRNSSNTTRLAEICMHECAQTYHIESADELDNLGVFGDIDAANNDGVAQAICPSTKSHNITIGITAGASTPASQITSVIEKLEQLQ